jgi:DNA-binding NarL/FixJ family response regulator
MDANTVDVKAMDAKKIRLFAADDHALFRDGVRALLSATPDIVLVGEAANGADAIDEIVRLQPDVVLMDVNMPGINGIEAIRRISHLSPQASVIVVTMLEDDSSLYSAMRAGARGYVLKGANHLELLQSIRAVAQGQVLFGPSIASRVTHFFTTTAPSPEATAFPELTERERQILQLMARHYGNSEIAQQLGVSAKTISNHVSNIFNKLQVTDRAGAILRAREAGLE